MTEMTAAEQWLKANGFQEGPFFNPGWREWTSPKGMRIQWVPYQSPPWTANIGDGWTIRYGLESLAGGGDSPEGAVMDCLKGIRETVASQWNLLARYLEFVEKNQSGTTPDPP